MDRSLAMTGEITLRGRVLPIGGLTEKLLAARRGNITNVLMPRDNERNLREVPQNIRDSLNIELVDNVDEVLQRALIVREGETLFKDLPLEPLYSDFPISSHNTPAQEPPGRREGWLNPGNTLSGFCFLLDWGRPT